ncbi:MAG TPA: hypothetical protein VKR53_19515 [Puia sp.]|nr:hypothetical protein [Puia sp.]
MEKKLKVPRSRKKEVQGTISVNLQAACPFSPSQTSNFVEINKTQCSLL